MPKTYCSVKVINLWISKYIVEAVSKKDPALDFLAIFVLLWVIKSAF
jgi:hypothetical protein